MLLQENDVIQGAKGCYQVQGKIGSESTFGAVYKALDPEGNPVVVKQLLGPGRIGSDMDYEYTRATFEREAGILLGHNHAQIVRGIEFFGHEQDLFLVMEYINGEDLDQVLLRILHEPDGRPFAEPEACAIGHELCRVIHAIHQLPGQVLYRDLKPRNIMWDARARKIKIIDFGTARFMERGRHSTQALGTPGYAPPEFYSTASPLSFASDVYTIGATLYELVTGEVPEPLMTPTGFHGMENGLSVEFRAIIAKAMAQEPARRYQTAEEMAAALARLPAFQPGVPIVTKLTNPFPYLSCLCSTCGATPQSENSVFCTDCGGKIHVMMLRLQPSSGHLPGMDLFLDKRVNLIGRAELENRIYPDVVLSRYDPDCYVSRRHCYLKRDGVRYYLEALASTNPTKVNQQPVSPGRSVEISDGDAIEIAGLQIFFIVKPCLA